MKLSTLFWFDRVLGSETRAVEALLSFNALISGISMLEGDLSNLAADSHFSLILNALLLKFTGPILIASFCAQLVGCFFFVFYYTWNRGIACRQVASTMRAVVWCAMCLLLFFGLEGFSRLGARYILFFFFEAWVMMSLYYRGA
jgi:glucose-6-phosphate-specific signal transduction histidine kinase